MYTKYAGQVFCLLFFLGNNLFINAQERLISNYTGELNIKLTSSDEKKIEKGIEILIEADKQLSQAESRYLNLSELELKEKISENYEQALEELKAVSELYKEGNMSIHQVFKEKCETFWTRMKKVQHFAAGVEKGKYYESQSRKHMLMAQQRRDQASWTDRYEYARVKIREANELENEAIRDQGRALQIYTDYPVEYNYEWENDITLEEVYEIYKNPAVNEPPEDIYATVDTDAKVDPVLMKEIIFKVQIAAHTVPLTEEYLRIIYKGGMPIDMIYEDEWYKYSIGRFTGFEEATKVLEECKVRKAFIVAYQDGKKLTIKEAIELMEKMQ
ncbi:MAG: hypothetical protein JW723_06910 [Bacteroidales bacterium]|nr:hypothetical protein [Bacteroidales bacterium]